MAAKHGMSHTPIHHIWRSMKDRCGNPKSSVYRYYGARGVKVCEGWLVFNNFYIAVGPRPEGKSLDRFPDKAGHYSCGRCQQCQSNGWLLNVRWATKDEQSRNLRSNTWLTVNGCTLIAADWARITGLSTSIIHKRLRQGMSDEDALRPTRISAIKRRAALRAAEKVAA